MRPEIEEMYARWVELGIEVEELVARRNDLRARIREFTGGVEDADAEISELTAEATRLAERVAELDVDFVGDVLLNAPLLDFMAPSLTVQQTITPNIVDELNFIRFQKMDRCTSCHIAIDREGYEGYPQPYTTHPNLEAYVGSASSHPLATTGCTVCHEGMGQSIGFVHASHTPDSEEQMHAWEAQYGWEVPHLWDYPMLPVSMTEASCAKCHTDTGARSRSGDPEPGLRAVRTRRLLRLPHDHRVHGPAEAGTEPDEDCIEALTRVGWRRGSGTLAWSSRAPGCRASGTTRTRARRRTPAATRWRSTRSWRICSRTRKTTRSRCRRRRGATPNAGRRWSSPSAVWRATSPRTRTAWRPEPGGRSASRCRTSGTRPATNGCSIGSATRDTSAARPTCRTSV